MCSACHVQGRLKLHQICEGPQFQYKFYIKLTQKRALVHPLVQASLQLFLCGNVHSGFMGGGVTGTAFNSAALNLKRGLKYLFSFFRLTS